MLGPSLSQRFFGFVGALSLAGCANSLSNRNFYPDWPDSGDVLASDPCSVRREPEIVIGGSEAERAWAQKNTPNFSTFYGGKTNDQIRKAARDSVERSLQTLRRANPTFLCGLEKIQFLGEEDYDASRGSDQKDSVGYYSHEERILRIRLYRAPYPVVHEVGHHIHNLGYFAPTIRNFLSQAWVVNGEGQRVHRCEGPNCFLYEKAGMSPAEEWARTFENVLLTPTETVLKTNLNLEVVGRTVLQSKISLVFDLTSYEKPRVGSVRVGPAQTLPPSSFQVLAGGLYLFDAKTETMTEYLIKDGRFQASANKPGKTETLFWASREQESMAFTKTPFYAAKAGGHLFVMGRENDFAPSKQKSSPISLWELDPAGQQTLGALAERHYFSKETLLGGLLEIDGRVGYFSFQKDRLVLMTRAPGGKESAEFKSWTLPEKIIPIHVIPLNGADDLAILAFEDDDASYWNPKVVLLRATSGIRRGGLIEIERETWKNLRSPVRQGNYLLFPTYLGYGTTLGILAYDLSKDRFFAPTFVTEALPEEFKKAAGQLETVQLAASGDQLYLIASAQKGPTLVAPLELKW
jgi:hypothetical protein